MKLTFFFLRSNETEISKHKILRVDKDKLTRKYKKKFTIN